jgi:hypothetical protein
VQTVSIARPTDHIAYGVSSGTLGDTVLGNYTQINTIDHDNAANVGCFTLRGVNNTIVLFVAKGTYADVAAAKTALAGTSQFYQLATPVTTNYSVESYQPVFDGTYWYFIPSGLKSDKNMTVIMESMSHIIGKVDGSNQITMPGTGALDVISAAYRDDGIGDNGYHKWTEVKASCTLDTATRKVTIASADPAKDYFVDVLIKPEESTVGSSTVKYAASGRNMAKIGGGF